VTKALVLLDLAVSAEALGKSLWIVAPDGTLETQIIAPRAKRSS
jgi:hypothetical protein